MNFCACNGQHHRINIFLSIFVQQLGDLSKHVLQTQDKRTTHALAKTACFIIFLVFYKHALHGWSISTLLSTYLILRCGPYQLIALSPCLLNFLSLSMLHYLVFVPENKQLYRTVYSNRRHYDTLLYRMTAIRQNSSQHRNVWAAERFAADELA